MYLQSLFQWAQKQPRAQVIPVFWNGGHQWCVPVHPNFAMSIQVDQHLRTEPQRETNKYIYVVLLNSMSTMGPQTCPRVALRAPMLLAWIRPSLFSLRNSLTNPFHCFIYSSSLSLRWAKQNTYKLFQALSTLTDNRKCHLIFFMLSKLPHGLHRDITWAKGKISSFLPGLILLSCKKKVIDILLKPTLLL